MSIDFIFNGGATKRYHTWPVLHNQRIDSHSFGVAMLVARMALSANLEDGEGLSVPLLMAALTHDLAEQIVGDMPAPAKRNMSALLDMEYSDFRAKWGEMETQILEQNAQDWDHLISEKQRRWLKLADAMEGAIFCARERAMGNGMMAPVFANFRSYIRELLLANEEPAVMEIVNYIDDMWEQVNAN
ncbi:MAG: HD domain-containing protein [Desulfurellales bacterium]|nr:MAG: HD domain-containing protein [Desulfurellales bacterium]